MAGRIVRTGRLVLAPVTWAALVDVARLKGDPKAFALMLGGVRTPSQARDEMADDIAFWGARGIGIFAMREEGAFRGITGFHERPDGRGVALRFALAYDARGRGLAREGAGAALRFGHEVLLARIVAVAREQNRTSRLVLGGIGMTVRDRFERDGHTMLVYESLVAPATEEQGRCPRTPL